MPAASLTATLRRIERASGALATTSIAQMDEQLPWFAAMPPDRRSWITLVAQNGIASFVDWLRHPDRPPSPVGEVFGTAPTELARVVSLQQTVELVRVTVDVVEAGVGQLAAPGEETALREAVLTYSREVAFAAAQVYAGVAETRGAWDARLEAMVMDDLLRAQPDDALSSRAAAMGWSTVTDVAALVGSAPSASAQSVLTSVQRAARPSGTPVMAGVHGDRLMVVMGRLSAADRTDPVAKMTAEFGSGPVVLGPTVADLQHATVSATAALSGHRVAAAWPGAPRPVAAGELLPERALSGDGDAVAALLSDVYEPLAVDDAAGGALLQTVSGYLDRGSALEATARELYVHPNTVRYRLRRVAELTGRSATNPRDAYVLRIAITLGRLAS